LVSGCVADERIVWGAGRRIRSSVIDPLTRFEIEYGPEADWRGVFLARKGGIQRRSQQEGVPVRSPDQTSNGGRGFGRAAIPNS
jgi:hypothetical protein